MNARVKLTVLAAGSNPVESDEARAKAALDGDWNNYRRVYCRRYTNCLDWAVDQRWDGFTCRECQVEDEMTTEERKAADSSLVSLLERALATQC